MGNCQAVDAATLVIQHPNGKVENLYWSVTAAEVMKTNPGHCVALLLSTTLYPPPPTAAAANQHHRPLPHPSSAAGPVRLTRIKLLRPTDTLTLGHAYRLITNQEVMKGLRAKKQSKLSQTHIVESSEADIQRQRKQSCSSTQPLLSSDESTSRRSRSSHLVKKKEQSRTESRSGSRNGGSSSSSSSLSISEGSGSGSGRLRASSWQPSLHSILESAAGGGSNSGI